MVGTAQRPINQSAGEGRRYSAFISYSHADEAFAKRLHRQLEAYRLPHRALARSDGAALAGARLKPVFRDIEELTAAHDLTGAVQDAIGQSDHLIVICSPNAVASPWVDKEIALFRALNGEAGVLAVLASGDPAEAFPAALRGAGLEPLAADFRGDATGRRLGLLKLVAALAHVRLDELMQRDAQRRMRNLAIVAGGAVASLALVAGLTTAALTARAEADAQRKRAGGLGAFMTTDLRKGLQSSGRLDLQLAADKAALESYRGQDLSHLPPDALAQRAKVLHAAGEDSEKHGDLAAAQAFLEEARRTTAALLAAKPNDPQRIFDHAQSEYWVGFINWRKGDPAGARRGFDAYAMLAKQLIRIDPANDAWLMENAYAANNLGMLALRQAGNPVEAQVHFAEALRVRRIIARHKPDDPDVRRAIANALGWVADSQRVAGDLKAARATREEQHAILAALLAEKPGNIQVQSAMLGYELAMARIEAAGGDGRAAIHRLQDGDRAALALARSDPDNKDFGKQARMFELFKVRTWLDMPARDRPPLSAVASALGTCKPAAPSLANEEIDDFCDVLLARIRTASGDPAGAAAALAPVRAHALKQHDVLTAHWGLNLPEETRTLQVAYSGGTK